MQPHELDTTIYNLLMERGVEIDDVIRATTRRGHGPAAQQHRPVRGRGAARHRGRAGSRRWAGRSSRRSTDYDVILIDCQPSLGLLTINALACADGVLIPLACEFFSLRGVALLMDTIDKVQDRLNPDLEIIGILATMFDPRTLHTREVQSPRGRGVRRPGVRRRDQPDGPVPGDHGRRRADHHAGRRSRSGAEAYRALAREVIAR